jgi:hypothetical protein
MMQAWKVPALEDTCRMLNEKVETLTSERDLYFRNAQTIEELSNKVVQYHNENLDLQNQLNAVKRELGQVKAGLEQIIQPISARQIASNADLAAMNLIFPGARKKPFCLKSLSNLISFIRNPNSAEFTSPLGPKEWSKLAESVKQDIKSKLDRLLESRPYLNVSIKTLKDSAWKQVHATTNIIDTVAYYKNAGDDESADAVEECAQFLESVPPSPPSDPAPAPTHHSCSNSDTLDNASSALKSTFE